jgi:hypothetical protein
MNHTFRFWRLFTGTPWPALRSLGVLVCMGAAALAASACWRPAWAAQATDDCTKMALLVGNARYSGEWSPLKNPLNDAQDLGQRLQALGWQTQVLGNAGLAQMDDAVNAWVERAKRSQACQLLLYFSGHGLEWERGAYLIPTDLASASGAVVESRAMSLQTLVGKLQRAPGLKVVMVDACRTRPGSKGDAGGLPRPDADKPLPSEVLVAYATEAGAVANDEGVGRNGVYASALLKVLGDASLSRVGGRYIDVMSEVEQEAMHISRTAVGRMQKPAYYGQLSATKRFVFAPVALAGGASANASTAQQAVHAARPVAPVEVPPTVVAKSHREVSQSGLRLRVDGLTGITDPNTRERATRIEVTLTNVQPYPVWVGVRGVGFGVCRYALDHGFYQMGAPPRVATSEIRGLAWVNPSDWMLVASAQQAQSMLTRLEPQASQMAWLQIGGCELASPAQAAPFMLDMLLVQANGAMSRPSLGLAQLR